MLQEGALLQKHWHAICFIIVKERFPVKPEKTIFKKGAGMNKLIVTAVVATLLAGSTMAQNLFFGELWSDWIEFNNNDKDAAYKVIQEINNNIREEFPMDPQLKATLDQLVSEKNAALDAKAKELGFTSFKEAYGSSDPRAQEIKTIEMDYSNRINNLRSAYDTELNRRIDIACYEAVKRLMENAETMK